METWKDIPNYEGYYQVSSLGQVRSLDRLINTKGGKKRIARGQPLRLYTDKDGYLRVTLRDNGRDRGWTGVHQLVAEAFIGPKPDGDWHVHHRNEDKTNNAPDNLEWRDKSSHMSHHQSDGKSSLRGTRHWQNRLSEQDVVEIKQLLAHSTFKQGEIAKRYGVGRTTINEINMGRAWAWLTVPVQSPGLPA